MYLKPFLASQTRVRGFRLVGRGIIAFGAENRSYGLWWDLAGWSERGVGEGICGGGGAGLTYLIVYCIIIT